MGQPKYNAIFLFKHSADMSQLLDGFKCPKTDCSEVFLPMNERFWFWAILMFEEPILDAAFRHDTAYEKL